MANELHTHVATLMLDGQARVNRALDRWMPSGELHPQRLHEAMRYAALNGGKRFRPILVYSTAGVLGGDLALADAPACAVELIHAYSLVHDDLPAMDNDDLRRGKPTCHRAFDEATAILAGDALQALAFDVLTRHTETLAAPARLKMLEILAAASGSRGMAGGQAIDLAAVGRTLDIAELEDMHIHKTGALIRASVLLGAHCCPTVDDDTLHALDRYGKWVGLAFQVWDDILDVEGSTGELGKPQGSDEARNKPTYAALLTLPEAKRRAAEHLDKALACLEPLGSSANALRELARYVITRRS
jgi:farnesyl diphosphate synthase